MEILKFEPLLKQTLWGGNRIAQFKNLDSAPDHVGESWELSGVAGSETVVAQGLLKGTSLNELVQRYKEQLVGRDNYERYGDVFPLLIKFIDACRDLSIQVHPDDDTARRQGHERGKTEMWYVLDADDGASLYSGLQEPLTPARYEAMVADDTITDALARHEVHPGDVFFIPAGRIHAIGAGCFVAEIQQTSDVTYRIYDYKRKDKDGHYRELHTKEAAEAIDYSVYSDYRTDYIPQKDVPQQLVTCPYFTTAVYDLIQPMTLDYSDLDSFVVLIGLAGHALITAGEQQVTLNGGETVLIPATAGEVRVEGTIKFLETFS